jgi:flagellar basal body L-ring protein FlgH
MWNRRQRELWLDRQLKDLQTAREAYVAGTATEEQLEILRNEKIGEIEQQKRKEADEQKLWNRTKKFLFEGLKKEDVPDTITTTGAVSELLANNNKTATTTEGSFGILEAVNAKKAETQSDINAQGPGSLDVLASNAETTAKQSVKGWTSWIWGR